MSQHATGDERRKSAPVDARTGPRCEITWHGLFYWRHFGRASGWRDTTLDIDLKPDPEPTGFFEALPKLKNEIDINIELAAPDDFVPALPGWKERSLFIERQGPLEFYHYDFYGQALSKIERWHKRDQIDVARMLEDRLVERTSLWELFCAIESKLVRYPSVQPPKLKARMIQVTGKS